MSTPSPIMELRPFFRGLDMALIVICLASCGLALWFRESMLATLWCLLAFMHFRTWLLGSI